VLHRLPRSATICNGVNHKTYEFPYPPRISSRAVTTSFLRVAAPRRVKSLERLARALGVPVMEQLE